VAACFLVISNTNKIPNFKDGVDLVLLDTPIPPKSNSIHEVIEFQLQKELEIWKKILTIKFFYKILIFFLKINGWMEKGGIFKLIGNYCRFQTIGKSKQCMYYKKYYLFLIPKVDECVDHSSKDRIVSLGWMVVARV
jgi:hypothetical protein